ncbi:RNA-binding domain-containing protein [Trametes versicolor FP-101664 SS1]|uniref:RNA-binding domain-containing protein n=1 Tax=Trametes versicolor (strain FP-101664) TaxID=717944 RepID=UPI0004622B85|nr:RNA-binding domain-containing protein [Trametes versicolor FP-101664 SS1]EIW57716.1 RNA-binding domain-containing protein [Trametes versicolor FP-101664 SS1]
MAKGAAAAEKPTKLAKKKSQQDLKADAPIKTKKAKQVEEVATPAATETPSSSKAKKEKKEKKGKEAVKESESAPAPAPVKAKGEKKKQVSIAEDSPAKAEKAEAASPADKKKRKAAAVEEKAEESPEKSKKKRRGSVAAPSAEVVSKEVVKEAAKPKFSKKSKPTPEESPVQPAPSKKEGKKTKAKAAPKAPSPEPAESADEAEADEAEEEDGEKEFYGFSSDDDDSSDEEMADDIPGIDIGKLPTIAKDDETVKRKLEKAKRKPTEDRGVIYLGRIPHGFFEAQMRAYFAQFGTVTRLRLSRNKKTGKSKHYAFIEFDSSSVAQIVAETMDNYLLMGHILTCKLIPKDQVHPELWVGANRKWRAVPRDRVARVAHNKPRTEEQQDKAESRLLKRQDQRKRKLEEAGIKYDFEAVAYKKKPKATEA